jgi:hypothetical protein
LNGVANATSGRIAAGRVALRRVGARKVLVVAQRLGHERRAERVGGRRLILAGGGELVGAEDQAHDVVRQTDGGDPAGKGAYKSGSGQGEDARRQCRQADIENVAIGVQREDGIGGGRGGDREDDRLRRQVEEGAGVEGVVVDGDDNLVERGDLGGADHAIVGGDLILIVCEPKRVELRDIRRGRHIGGRLRLGLLGAETCQCAPDRQRGDQVAQCAVWLHEMEL